MPTVIPAAEVPISRSPLITGALLFVELTSPPLNVVVPLVVMLAQLITAAPSIVSDTPVSPETLTFPFKVAAPEA